ncbi:amidase [Schauerella aestuarii]|uniref:amidase n=1 Tax=Schauerella aestuarii TaxID=2511204 RepID=UPI001928B2F7|nr:amidase [Achromobacter aestuarii]
MITPAGLPDSIAALRADIASGRYDPIVALRAQRDAIAHDAGHCVAALLDLPATLNPTAPLAGVGVAHKDIFDLAERAAGCGRDAAAIAEARATGAVPDRAAPVVQRLANAGATPLAALVMAEHACGATGENPHAPRVVNPVDTEAVVGGSSSGSGAAVAAGLCYGALGTDTAGSVRMPAATCGVLGFKPSRHRLSNRGVVPLAPGLDTVGLLTRSTADAAALLAACSTIRMAAPPSRWRIAHCWDRADTRLGMTAEVAKALHAVTDEFARAGSTCTETPLPHLAEWTRLADVMLHTEAATTHAQALAGQGPVLHALPRAVALAGAVIPAPWYAQAYRSRTAHRALIANSIFNDADVLLTPALPRGVPDWRHVHTASPDFDARQLVAMFSWMAFVNYLDLPAAVFPVAYADDGRPICLQAIARRGDEGTLLAFAADIERRRFDGRGFRRSFTPSAGSPAALPRR